jgi:hypothetical protein
MLVVLLVVLLVVPRLVATVSTGTAPCGAAAGFGALWAANDGSGTLLRVDPSTNRVTRRVLGHRLLSGGARRVPRTARVRLDVGVEPCRP